MGTYKVDTDVISSAVEKLIQLKAKCEEDAAITVPSSGKNSGNMHNKTVELCAEMKNAWVTFIALIDKTIDFLDKDKSTIETQDKTWSQGIGNKSNVTPIARGSGQSTASYLHERQYNNTSYISLNVKDDYPDQLPNQCYANGISISNSILENEGIDGSIYEEPRDYSVMASDIANGKPVMFHFLHENSGGEHWLVAVGFKEAATKPYDVFDFLFVDTYDGKVKTWENISYEGSFYINAAPANDMKRF